MLPSKLNCSFPSFISKTGEERIQTRKSIIEKYKDFNFGKFEIKKFELVFNDWYLRNENTRILNVFKSNT